jgi:hypothetical protein
LYRANSDFECNRNQNLQFSSSETTLKLRDPEYTAEDLLNIQKCLEESTHQLTGSNNGLSISSWVVESSVFSGSQNLNNSNSNPLVNFEDELYQNFSLQTEEETSTIMILPSRKRRTRFKIVPRFPDDPRFKPPNQALVITLKEVIKKKGIKFKDVAKALEIRHSLFLFYQKNTHYHTLYHRLNKLSHETIQSSNKYYFFNQIFTLFLMRSPSTLCKYIHGEPRQRGWGYLEDRISDWLYQFQGEQPSNSPSSPN